MNIRPSPIPTPSVFASGGLLIAALLLPINAARANDELLKNVTVLGSLATYGFALTNRSSLDCRESYRFGLHSGSDNELSSVGISGSLRDCETPLDVGSFSGVRFRLMPSIMATNWKASSGANQNGLFEATLVPRAQFLAPYRGMYFDATLGIGVSYLTATSIGTREKSTAFQFSDELSLGLSDATQTIRLAFQYRHISNLGIKTPNNPVDFRGLTLSIHMR